LVEIEMSKKLMLTVKCQRGAISYVL
jgi:hypothetical protein